MKEEHVKYETVVLAIEKGFNIPTLSFYLKETESIQNTRIGKLSTYDSYSGNPIPWKSREVISAPTQSLLQKWLRDNHAIYVSIKYKPDEIINKFELSIYKEIYHRYTEIYATYEQALEEGLKHGLTLIEI